MVDSKCHNNTGVTQTQKEVLRLLTDEFETPNNIAILRKTSIQATYKTINILKKKGFLTTGNVKGLKKVRPTKLKIPKNLMALGYMVKNSILRFFITQINMIE